MRFPFQQIKSFNVISFKKWGRKKYSLFSVLNKLVRISVLPLAYFFSVPLPVISVPRDTTEIQAQYDLDEVEVTAARSPVLYSQVARILTVIRSQEIEQMPAESVQDLLEYIAGVDIRQRGAEGIQADLSIRGGTFDQTLILLNGINITDPQTGHHNLNLPVSLSLVDRIEVLEGPAGRIYGPNAFSGAINIVTKKAESNSILAELSAGNYGYLNTALSGSFKTGSLNNLLGVNWKTSNGYINNTDFRISNAYYSGEIKFNSGDLFFQGGIGEKAFGANSFYTPRYPDQFEENNTSFGSVKFKTETKINLTPSFYWRRHSDKFMLFRDEAPEWYSNHNFHRTDVWGADINSWFLWKYGKSSLGVSLRSEGIISNVLGEPMSKRIEVRGEDTYYTNAHKRRTLSLFAGHDFLISKWHFHAGILANHISDMNGGLNYFPGLDLSYQVSKSFKLVTSWNTSLRMPTFTDLYYEGPTNIGNPDLKPEKSATLEGGIKLNTKKIKGHLLIFTRKGNNLIDWVKSYDEDVWSSMNHTTIYSRGMEINLNYLPSSNINWLLPDNFELSYLFNRQQKEDSEFISYYVMDYLRHKIVAGFTESFGNRILLNLKAVYQDREGTFSFYQSGDLAVEREYEPFWTVDAKINYQVSDFNIYLTVNNVFDYRYYDIGNVIQPGRWIKAGITYRFW